MSAAPRFPRSPRPSPPKRVPPVVWTVLAWCGACTYPFVLHVTMRNARFGFSVLEVLLSAALTVLTASLLRREPLPALALLLVAWFSAVLVKGTPEVGLLQVLVADLAVGFIAATRSRRTTAAAAVLAFTAQTGSVSYYTSGSDEYLQSVAFVVVALAAVWMAGGSFRERREHAEALRSQATDQAVTAERLRIARELHDMIAHSIGVIAIQAGVGSRVIDTQPDEARNALTTIETTSRETLAGLRRTLGALRRTDNRADGPVSALGPGSAPLDPAPGLADLDRLAASTLDAGVRVDVRWRGERHALPLDIDMAAYRILQEALTNVVRHAGTQDCRVTIGHRDDKLSLEVVDDGRGAAVGSGFGWGLVGLRERVGLLRGHFTAGPRPEGGFRVAVHLPVPARPAPVEAR